MDAWDAKNVAPVIATGKQIEAALSRPGSLEAHVGDLARAYRMAMSCAAVQLMVQKKLAATLQAIENDWYARGKDPKSYEPEPGKTSYLSVLRRALQNIGTVLAGDEHADIFKVNPEWDVLIKAAYERGHDPFTGTGA